MKISTSQGHNSGFPRTRVYGPTSKHSVNLRRNRTLHFQIGLILTLLCSILFIEMRTDHLVTAEVVPPVDDNFEMAVIDFTIEAPAPIVKTPEPVVAIDPIPEPVIDIDQLFPDDPDLTESDVPPTVDPEPSTRTFLSGVDYVETTEVVETLPMRDVQFVPIFPGCESLATNGERISCFNSKMQRIVQRNFNTDIAADLGLEGVNRIYAEFEVTKDGTIALRRIRAPHPALEKEAKRVVGKIPTMKPGKMGDTPVGVIYNLPIIYKVTD